MEISQEQFSTWLEDPVTKSVRQLLHKWLEDRKDQWAQGAFLGEGHFPTLMENARALGNVEICQAVLDLEVSQLNEVE